ncbi:hypothetical protein D3C86_1451860 [compost metagenome]
MHAFFRVSHVSADRVIVVVFVVLVFIIVIVVDEAAGVVGRVEVTFRTRHNLHTLFPGFIHDGLLDECNRTHCGLQ